MAIIEYEQTLCTDEVCHSLFFELLTHKLLKSAFIKYGYWEICSKEPLLLWLFSFFFIALIFLAVGSCIFSIYHLLSNILVELYKSFHIALPILEVVIVVVWSNINSKVIALKISEFRDLSK